MANQPEVWLKFYEAAWGKRQDLLKDYLSKKDVDAFAAVQMLHRYEKLHSLSTDERTRQLEYKRDQPESGAEVLPTGLAATQYAAFGESYFELPRYIRAVDFLLDYLDANSFDAIVELGGGYGQNLVEIYSRGGPRNIPYFCGEYTDSGVETARILANHCTGLKLLPFKFDHKQPDLSLLGSFKKVFIFTSHSIEQVTELPTDYFKKLAATANDVTGVHFEPFGYQIDLKSEDQVSKTQREYFQSQKWNQNFYSTLMGAHQKNEIHVTYLHKNVIAGDPTCPTSLAIWESKKLV